MADDTLERRYRRLLFAYPTGFRVRYGDELITTLVDCAAPGRRVPRPAEAANLIGNGLCQRIGLNAIAGLPEGLANAAPIALALAAGLAAHVWWQPDPPAPHPGTGALGPLVYLAWMLAGLAAAAPRRTVGRTALAIALVVTVVVVPALAAATTATRPPLWILMALTGFGVVSCFGGGTTAGAFTTRPADIRLAVPAGAVAFAATAWAVTRAWPPDAGGYYAPLISRVGMVAAATTLTIAVVAAVRLLRRNGDGNAWLWTAVLLGLPAGWLGPFGTAGGPPLADGFLHFGRLAQVVFATCVAAATMRWLAGNRDARAPVGAQWTLPKAGSCAIGCAAGLSIGIPLFAGAAPWPVATTVLILIVLGLASWSPAGGAHHWRVLLATAGATVPGTWLVALYANDWSIHGRIDAAYTATLAATIAFVPLTLGVVIAVRDLREPPHPTKTPRWAAVAALAASGGWLGFWTLPHLPSWGPVLLVFAGCVAALWISRSRTRERILG